ncbi:MAG: hypothetical protein K2P45_07685, partial [Eubacterium sp.]|nr:hypothetical protein [Eubacterium sp.]
SLQQSAKTVRTVSITEQIFIVAVQPEKTCQMKSAAWSYCDFGRMLEALSILLYTQGRSQAAAFSSWH